MSKSTNKTTEGDKLPPIHPDQIRGRAQRALKNAGSTVDEVKQVCRPYGDPDTVFEDAMQIYEKRQERELYRSYFAELNDEARAETAGWRQIGEKTASRLRDKQRK